MTSIGRSPHLLGQLTILRFPTPSPQPTSNQVENPDLGFHPGSFMQNHWIITQSNYHNYSNRL